VQDVARSFIDRMPPPAGRLVNLLAIPESLTDEVALRLYALAPLENISGTQFIEAFKQTSFVQPRNSEWSLNIRVRDAFLSLNAAPLELVQRAHTIMLDYVETAEPEQAGSIIPNYIYTLAGKAYHQAGSGKTEEALGNYGAAATLPHSGQQWLATRLGREQQRLGIFPPDQIEILFLQAITLYREGHRSQAKPFLEQIVAQGQSSLAMAMALNMLGNMVAAENPKRAETLLQQGIEMSAEVGNNQGVAIGQHNLGVLIGKDFKRLGEAEALLYSSIAAGEESGNIHHASMVRHSLAHLLNKPNLPERREEVETLLRTAIADLKDVKDEGGAGQATHTLAIAVSRDTQRKKEAELLFRQSIAISEKENDSRSMQMRLFSLARFLIRAADSLTEGLEALERAKAIAKSFGLVNEVKKMNDFERTIR
jgi:tetratricopeptide (TPR) repeat protein